MAGLGVERIAFLFVQHGAQDVSRSVNGLANSLFRLQTISDRLGGENNLAQNLGRLMSSLGDTGARLAAVGAGAVLGASAIARFTTDIAKTGGHMIGARQQFENTSQAMGTMAGIFLPNLREAMLGSVSDMDIMRLANFALAAGLKVSAADFTRLAEASTKLAIIHGRDAPEALQRLTFGVIKQERRILDELGIVIRAKDVFKEYAASIHKTADELTASERVQAFFKATLTAAEEQTKSFTGVNFGLASIGDRLSATFENFANKLAVMFVQGGYAERLFKALDAVLASVMSRLSDPGQAEAFFGGIVAGATALVRLAGQVLQIMIDLAPYAERLLKAFVGFQAGSAAGNILGSIASLFGPVGQIIGGGLRVAAPLIGAGVGFFGSSTPSEQAREISAAIEPRLSVTENQVRDMSSILKNQLYSGAPGYVPVAV